MLLPGMLVTLIYAYGPILGVVMAFQKFEPALGFLKSEWVGIKNFPIYIQYAGFYIKFIRNTILIASLKIIFSITVPLILALLLNEITKKWFQRMIQTSVFLPFFLAWTVLGGVILEMFSLRGPINDMLSMLWSGNDYVYGQQQLVSSHHRRF
jgi:putative aldouronate transport system permease protein